MIDQQLINDYRRFVDNVMQCYTYMVAGDEESTYTLISLTSGQAIGFASRLGLLNTSTPKTKEPWREIGISRATWYRDQKRSRDNERKNAEL